MTKRRKQHELLGFLVIWADQYQRDYKLDGLHPAHYDLMVKYGARMDSFKKATNAHGENAAPAFGQQGNAEKSE